MTTNWASLNPEMEYHIQAKKMLADIKEAGRPHKASKYFVEVIRIDDKEIEKELTGAMNITLYIRKNLSREEIQEKFENVLPQLKNYKRK